jgi:hypothetical protein
MSAAMTGALAGAALGLIGFGVLRHAADVQERQRGVHARRTAGILRMAALVDLILLPIVGYYAAALLLEGA